MALKAGKSLSVARKYIAQNLRELYGKGYDRDQALAIALGIAHGFRDGRRRKVSGRWVGGS